MKVRAEGEIKVMCCISKNAQFLHSPALLSALKPIGELFDAIVVGVGLSGLSFSSPSGDTLHQIFTHQCFWSRNWDRESYLRFFTSTKLPRCVCYHCGAMTLFEF
jgi:hypothetical protein